LKSFPDRLNEQQISVVYHPVTPLALRGAPPLADVCFIGYRTRFKGFDQFEALARDVPQARFVSIGGGVLKAVPEGSEACLKDSKGYMQSIGGCAVALFPYVGGYECSLSAAVLDALSAGVHVLATRRACFVSLAEHFGSEVVTLYDTAEEARALLADSAWLQRQRAGQAARQALLQASRFGIPGVRDCFEQLMRDRPAALRCP
jgi:hypothetical protein